MNNKFLIYFFLVFISYKTNSQNQAFTLLDQRLEDMRLESEALGKKQKELAGLVHTLRIENKRLKFNAAYHEKELIRNETALQEALQSLYDTQNKLVLKIAEASVLEQQVKLLQSEKSNLTEQLNNLASTDTLLKKQLKETQDTLSGISKDLNDVLEAAKYESLANSFRYPRGYYRKKFSVVIAEGGFLNIGQGFTTNVAVYSYLIPSRNILGGFGIGADFYSRYRNNLNRYESFFLLPLTMSFRGNFGPQDFFTLKREIESRRRFNMNWMIDFGWSFLIKDTSNSRSFDSNALMGGGIGLLWPSYRNFGMGFSAGIKIQRLKSYTDPDNSDAILLPMFVLKMAFFLRK